MEPNTILEFIDDDAANNPASDLTFIASLLGNASVRVDERLGDGGDDLTFFAPTDDAFLAAFGTIFGAPTSAFAVLFGLGVINEALIVRTSDPSFLDTILSYHATAPSDTAAGLVNAERIETLAGPAIKPGPDGFGDADPEVADPETTGGSVHSNGNILEIDSLLLFADFTSAQGGAPLNGGLGKGRDVGLGSSFADDFRLGKGADWGYGGVGADTIAGGKGDDRIGGDTGADSLIGGAGDDTIAGGDGLDTLRGGDGNDLLDGDGDADVIRGDAGADTLWGATGEDTLNGGKGRDSLLGGADDDVMIGGRGRDVFDVDAGDDTMTGGRGADRFEFTPTGSLGSQFFGDDVITDFDRRAGDLVVLELQLNGPGFASRAAAAGDPNALEAIDLFATGDLALGTTDGDLLLIGDYSNTLQLVDVSPMLTEDQVARFLEVEVIFLV